MKKTRLLLPLVASMLLASCNTSVDTRPHITFWYTFSYTSIIESMTDAYNEAHPETVVEAIHKSNDYGGLKDNVIAGVPANNYPDLIIGYPDHVAEYLNAGIAVDVMPYIEDPVVGWSEEEKEDMIPEFLDEGMHYSGLEGQCYSLPFAKSTEAMYYNEMILNVDLSTIDPTINPAQDGKVTAEYLSTLTWDEMFEKLIPALLTYNDTLPEGQKFYEKKKGEKDVVVGYHSGDNLFITLAQQYGYDYTGIDADGYADLKWNNAGMKELMKKFNVYANKGYIHTQDSMHSSPSQCFQEKRAIFSIGSTGGVSYNHTSKFEVGVTFIPRATSEESSLRIINQGPSIAFLNHKDKARLDLAWDYYKFITNEENSCDWAITTGYSPVRKSVLQSDAYLDYCDTSAGEPLSIELLTAKSASYIPTANKYLFFTPVFYGSSYARENVGKLIAKILEKKTEECTDAFIDEAFQNSIDETLHMMG